MSVVSVKTVFLLTFVEVWRSLTLSVTADLVMSEEHGVGNDVRSTMTPIILSSPSQLSVLVGDTVVLPCRVEHMRNHVVSWKRGRTRILFAGQLKVDTDKTFSLTNGTYLQIENITPEYAGEYLCQVNSKRTRELVHTLHVLVSPTVTVDPPNGLYMVQEGKPIIIQCDADGYPQPVVVWRAIKGVLPGGVREKQGKTLSYHSAAVRHTGTYECTAENGVGKEAKAIVKVKVLYGPEINVNPLWQHAGEGSSVTFSCSAMSEPPATLYWTRFPPDTLERNKHVFLSKTAEDLVLRIRQIKEEHFGSYVCFANNSIGSAYRAVEISGLAERVVFKSNQSGEDESSFLLIWTVKSYSPVIEYLLRIRPHKSKDSNSQPPSWVDVMIPVEMEQKVLHSHSYNITGLEAATGYEVVMQARNLYGWNYPSDTYSFYTKGLVPSDDRFENMEQKETITDPSEHETNSSPQTTGFHNTVSETENPRSSSAENGAVSISLMVLCFVLASFS